LRICFSWRYAASEEHCVSNDVETTMVISNQGAASRKQRTRGNLIYVNFANAIATGAREQRATFNRQVEALSETGPKEINPMARPGRIKNIA